MDNETIYQLDLIAADELAAVQEIAAWGTATHGIEDAAEAIAAAARERDGVPRRVRRSLERLAGIAGGPEALARYQLGPAFDALESIDPGAFEPYRRRRLDPPPRATLQALAEERGITRERVRQLELRFNWRLQKTVRDDPDNPIAQAGRALAGALGMILPVDRLPDALRALGPRARCLDDRPDRVALLLDLAGSYAIREGWIVHPRFAIDGPAKLESMVPDKGHAPLDVVVDGLAEVGLRGEDCQAWIEDLPGYRIYSGQVIRLGSSMADRGVAILRIHGRPMTLEHIFDELGEQRSLRGFAGQMQGDPRVRRLGLKEYGLAEWGGDEYVSVIDQMKAAILAAGGSCDVNALASDLSERFGVSPSSIRTYAAGHPFCSADGQVALDETAAAPLSRPLAHTRSCFRHADGWAFRRVVDNEVLRGSGSAIPVSFARALALAPSDSKSLRGPFGQLNCSWPSNVPLIGSLRAAAEQVDAVVGDYLFVVALGDERVQIRHLAATRFRKARGLERLALECGAANSTVQEIGRTLGIEAGRVTADLTAIRQQLRIRGEHNQAKLLSWEDGAALLDALTRL